MRQPLFLIASQRSGSTALAHALSRSLAGQQGGTFTVNGKLWYLLRRWLTVDDLDGRHLRVDEMMHALRRRPAEGTGAARWLETVDRELRVAARAVAAGRYPATPDGVLALSRDLAGRTSADAVWGDKYNEYLLDLDYLRAVFPGARWLVLFREPAEVVSSMLAWTGDRPWNPRTAAEAEAKWAAWNRRWLHARDQLDPALVLQISYAELCSGSALPALCHFTDLAPDTFAGCFSQRAAARSARPAGAAATEVYRRLLAGRPVPPTGADPFSARPRTAPAVTPDRRQSTEESRRVGT